jgi:hypothetical protein
LPDGASIGRTTDYVRQVEEIIKKEPSVADYTATIGLNFVDNYSQPNAAFLIVSLKPFEERLGTGPHPSRTDNRECSINGLQASLPGWLWLCEGIRPRVRHLHGRHRSRDPAPQYATTGSAPRPRHKAPALSWLYCRPGRV